MDPSGTSHLSYCWMLNARCQWDSESCSAGAVFWSMGLVHTLLLYLAVTVDGRNPAPPGIKPYEYWDKLPFHWCRISSINSITGFLSRITWLGRGWFLLCIQYEKNVKPDVVKVFDWKIQLVESHGFACLNCKYCNTSAVFACHVMYCVYIYIYYIYVNII